MGGCGFVRMFERSQPRAKRCPVAVFRRGPGRSTVKRAHRSSHRRPANVAGRAHPLGSLPGGAQGPGWLVDHGQRPTGAPLIMI